MYLGTFKNHVASNMPKRKPDKETSQQVKTYMEENPTHSIRNATDSLEIPKSTVGFYTYTAYHMPLQK